MDSIKVISVAGTPFDLFSKMPFELFPTFFIKSDTSPFFVPKKRMFVMEKERPYNSIKSLS